MGDVKIKPTSTIVAKLGLYPSGPVQSFLTETCYKHMDKYVPKRDDNLRTIVDIEPSYIIYESPYAHAQYVGFTTGPVKNYTTPGTGPYWDKKMKSAEMKQVVKEVQEFVGGKK